ncbi:SNF2-related protein [Catalinimonas niigatensis]|uniref:SNF2-related protein n=1 Tax=Catalinimonas niigatensis TaxID=1397264 RepID=UPI0026650EC6|nr:SNF2-related protein [Catalinimonas niigatensis]WPP48925.1 helicase-related protein [Catalinimonas niigatensis]
MKHSPTRFRARIQIIEDYIHELPIERKAKNDVRSLLKQGYISPELYAKDNPYVLPAAESEEKLIEAYLWANIVSEEPLNFEEKASYSTWFAMHPEKQLGEEKVTSSFHFPLVIKGKKEDIPRLIRAQLEKQVPEQPQKESPTTDTNQKKLQAQARAIIIKMNMLKMKNSKGATHHTLSGLNGLAGLAGLSGHQLHATLGELPVGTLGRLDDYTLGKLVKPERKEEGKRSFEEVIRMYNQGITEDEIKVWVWYRRSLGSPMTSWKKYFLDNTSSADRDNVAYANAATSILDNQWHKIATVPTGSILGKPTKFEHEYSGKVYLVLTNPQGQKIIVLKDHVTIKGTTQQVSDKTLTDFVNKGLLFYSNGEMLPYPIYAYGNMYERAKQLEEDKDELIAKYGEAVFEKHKQVIAERTPKAISIQNVDPNERPKILAFSEFARSFTIDNLAEETGYEIADSYKDAQTGKISLRDAFWHYLQTLERTDFGNLSAHQIFYYYVLGRNMNRMDKAEAQMIMQYGPEEGEKLFGRFLHEGLALEDRQRIDFEWNRLYNGTADIMYHRIPVGFECSKTFGKNQGTLQFTPAQREAIAFMQAAGSGIVAYDVGVGKTMSAIIAMANNLYEGRVKRPVVVVPNPTYEKWKREIVGYTDKKTNQFVPGVLSHTGITINDWYNLGTQIRKGIDLEKEVPENSITMLTYEGFIQLGYSEKLQREFFDELNDIVMMKDVGKTNRDWSKMQKKNQKTVGQAQKGTRVDVDTLGFDFIVVDEAHNFKNVFTSTPTDDDGNKRFKMETVASDRAIKMFFMTNYIQRKFGRNVMLLTATPFTNSPLEVFSMLSMVAYDKMVQMGLKNIGSFLETFVLQEMEYANSYDGTIQQKYVVKRFNNRLLLQKLIHNHISYKTGEDAGVQRPIKVNLPKLYRTTPSGEVQRLGGDEQILTYLTMTEDQYAVQNQVIRLAMDKSRGGSILESMGQSLSNAISPYFTKLYNGLPPKDHVEFVKNSPKIDYTCQCIASVKKYHEDKGEAVSGQVIYMNRGKDYFPMLKKYLIEEVGYKQNVKHNKKSFDEVEVITSGISGIRKEAIKDAFQANIVKVIIGTSTITEGIDLQNHGTVLYILLPDWNPTSIRQVEGRIHRQKNRFGYVRIVMPLVNDSMDVFVFQKLEEKSSRINDLWYRSDRGNVLDQEALDPEEVKFALYTNIGELVKMELDKQEKENTRKKEVLESEHKTLLTLKGRIKTYQGFRDSLPRKMEELINRINDYFFGLSKNYEQQYYWRSKDEKQRKALIERIQDVVKDVQEFLSSTDRDDKELIRAGKRLLNLLGDISSTDWQFNETFSEFRAIVPQVRKAETTTLAKRNMSIHDDLSPILTEMEQEIKKVEAEREFLHSEENMSRLETIVREKKAKLQIKPGTITERAQDFASLNYLLDYSQADTINQEHSLLPNEVNLFADEINKIQQHKQISIAKEVEEEEREVTTVFSDVLKAKIKAKAIIIKMKMLKVRRVA